MGNYFITIKPKGLRTRRLAMLNGRVRMFKKKSSAKRIVKEYQGANPRIGKTKW